MLQEISMTSRPQFLGSMTDVMVTQGTRIPQRHTLTSLQHGMNQRHRLAGRPGITATQSMNPPQNPPPHTPHGKTRATTAAVAAFDVVRWCLSQVLGVSQGLVPSPQESASVHARTVRVACSHMLVAELPVHRVAVFVADCLSISCREACAVVCHETGACSV